MDFETSTYECFSKGLEHKDRIVRDTCLSYLKDHPVKTLDQARWILAELETYGPKRYSHLHLLEGFPLDSAALERVLLLCVKWSESGERSEVIRLLRWAGFGAGHEIGRVLEYIRSATGDPLDTMRTALFKRQSVWQLTFEAALERLEVLVGLMVDASEYPGAEISEAEVIVDYLAREHVSERLEALTEEWLLLPVDAKFEGGDCWKVGMAIGLCGRLGMEEHVDLLLSLYEIDSDWYNDRIAEAITAFNSNAALMAVCDRWHGLPWVAKLFVSRVFECRSADDLAGFYRDQMENDELDYLELSRFAIGYANYGVSETLSAAQAYLELHPENPELESLAEFLYTHYRLRGVEGDVVESLGESIRAYEADVKTRMEFGNAPSLPSRGAPANRAPTVAPSSGTIVREGYKVGRNDSCPCGSGKKYKKCCL